MKIDEETLAFQEHSDVPHPIQLSLARLFQGPVDITLPDSKASLRLAANADGDIEIHVRLKLTA